MIELISEYKLAKDSPDHHYPQGTKNVAGGPYYNWLNNKNPFVAEVQNYFNRKDISVLDLGAASGVLVDDFGINILKNFLPVIYLNPSLLKKTNLLKSLTL